MLYSVTFDKEVYNRYIVRLVLMSAGRKRAVPSILDTACATTLIPLRYAIEDKALIGLNVLHNLSLNLHRNSNVITFDYDPWERVKKKQAPVQCFLKKKDRSTQQN